MTKLAIDAIGPGIYSFSGFFTDKGQVIKYAIIFILQDKQTQEIDLTRHLPADLHVNSEQWLKGDPKHSFQNWKKILPKRGEFSEYKKRSGAAKFNTYRLQWEII